ncbi:MAG: hypothetical protein WCP32_06940 [Bacteroidota bacterium]
MAKHLYLHLLCLFLPLIIFGQQIEISVATLYAGNNMSDLKKMNEDAISQSPFETKVVNDFPAWFVFRASVAIVIYEHFKVGVVYNHSSTGSRVSSADYSGEYKFDILARGNSVGLLLGYKVFRYKKLDIQFNAIIGAMLSSCSFNEDLQVYGLRQSDALSMKSASLCINPEVGINYWFGILGAGVFGGYQYDFGGTLNVSGQKTTLSTNWSGFRVGITVMIMFPG